MADLFDFVREAAKEPRLELLNFLEVDSSVRCRKWLLAPDAIRIEVIPFSVDFLPSSEHLACRFAEVVLRAAGCHPTGFRYAGGGEIVPAFGAA